MQKCDVVMNGDLTSWLFSPFPLLLNLCLQFHNHFLQSLTLLFVFFCSAVQLGLLFCNGGFGLLEQRLCPCEFFVEPFALLLKNENGVEYVEIQEPAVILVVSKHTGRTLMPDQGNSLALKKISLYIR